MNFDFRYWWQNRYSDQLELGGEPYTRANLITPLDLNTPSRTLVCVVERSSRGGQKKWHTL